MEKIVIVSKKEKVVDVDNISIRTEDGGGISLPDTSKVKKGDTVEIFYKTEDGQIMPSSTVVMVIKGEVLVNRLSFMRIG